MAEAVWWHTSDPKSATLALIHKRDRRMQVEGNGKRDPGSSGSMLMSHCELLLSVETVRTNLTPLVRALLLVAFFRCERESVNKQCTTSSAERCVVSVLRLVGEISKRRRHLGRGAAEKVVAQRTKLVRSFLPHAILEIGLNCRLSIHAPIILPFRYGREVGPVFQLLRYAISNTGLNHNNKSRTSYILRRIFIEMFAQASRLVPSLWYRQRIRNRSALFRDTTGALHSPNDTLRNSNPRCDAAIESDYLTPRNRRAASLVMDNKRCAYIKQFLFVSYKNNIPDRPRTVGFGKSSAIHIIS